MKFKRKKAKDEFAVFVVAAAILALAAILYGILVIVPKVHPTIVRVYVPVDVHQSQSQTQPSNQWWTPIVEGKG